jgi:Rieske Fe-S protein
MLVKKSELNPQNFAISRVMRKSTVGGTPITPKNRLARGSKGCGAKQRANNANTNLGAEKSKEESHLPNQGRPYSKRSKSRKYKILMLNVTYHDNASKHDFLLYSGASSHMSCESSWLHNLHPIPSRKI